jgi:hypothetical protein
MKQGKLGGIGERTPRKIHRAQAKLLVAHSTPTSSPAVLEGGRKHALVPFLVPSEMRVSASRSSGMSAHDTARVCKAAKREPPSGLQQHPQTSKRAKVLPPKPQTAQHMLCQRQRAGQRCTWRPRILLQYETCPIVRRLVGSHAA